MEAIAEGLRLDPTTFQRLMELGSLSRGDLGFEVLFDGKTYRACVEMVIMPWFNMKGSMVYKVYAHLVDKGSWTLKQVSFMCVSDESEGGVFTSVDGSEISWIKAFLNGWQEMPA